MDPRRARSRTALREAILRLAADRALADITVAEVVALAGVSRPTFYAHAPSPGALAADALGDELESMRVDFERSAHRTPPGQPTMLTPERALVAHVARHADIYRRNLVAGSDGNLRALLVGAIERGLREHLLRNPGIAPSASADADTWSTESAVYAAIAAAGTVAGIERWLSDPGAIGQEDLVQILLRGNAEWWERSIDD